MGLRPGFCYTLLMRPPAGQVLHFSEDPTIRVFHPHSAPTSTDPKPYVWAVDADRCPDLDYVATDAELIACRTDPMA